MVTDVIFDLKTERDDVLIGVQRIPKDSHISYHGKMEGDLLQYYDFDYYESTNVLFVIVFDFQVGRYYRINLTSGTDLPDWNLYFVEASRKKWERLFFVKGDTLHYPLDQDGKIMTQYRFSDILRRGRPKKKRK
ncbi:MAG: hypothetical protein GY950_33080 [bacterium]|nr:hypothetical protein [bacterium]